MKTKGAGLSKVVHAEDIEAMAVAGMSQKQIADYYGISRQQMTNIIRENEELDHALSFGLQNVYVRCIKTIMSLVDNGTEKSKMFGAVYMLNNKFGWMEEKYRKEEKTTNFSTATIYIPWNGRDPLPENAISEDSIITEE